jgi:pyridoxine 4-dehydrogenase
MRAAEPGAAAAGSWQLGDLTVNRLGFGAMRLTGRAASGPGREAGASSDGDSAGVRAVARAHGATPAQVRLAWTLHQGPHVLAVPGTGDPGHLTENVAAAALRLPADDLARLAAA